MPSRRELIMMSEDEISHYLSTRSRMVLTTTGPAGWPHAVPVDFGIDDDGAFLATSFAKSQKVKNLERSNRATLLFESGETYDDLKGVMILALATIVRDELEVAKGMRYIRAEDDMAHSISPEMRSQIADSIKKRVVLHFEAIKFVSWDHRKIRGSY